MIRQIFCFLYSGFLIIVAGNELSAQDNDNKVYLRKICNLPAELHESSGIIFFKGLLWSFNDSGNRPIIYAIDTSTAKIQHKLVLYGAKNIDWEAINQNEDYIYIGDIGNNGTNRNNFQIYKIPKDSLTFSGWQLFRNFETITFSISDEHPYLKKNFDAEAMLIDSESVVVYTKDWENYHTTSISIPVKPGTHIAKIGNTYNVEGLITASTIGGDDIIFMTGYAFYVPFIVKLNSDLLLNDVSEIVRFDMPEFFGIQNEAITRVGEQYFLSCESSYFKQALYEIIF